MMEGNSFNKNYCKNIGFKGTVPYIFERKFMTLLDTNRNMTVSETFDSNAVFTSLTA
jgi:hypothetical protein